MEVPDIPASLPYVDRMMNAMGLLAPYFGEERNRAMLQMHPSNFPFINIDYDEGSFISPGFGWMRLNINPLTIDEYIIGAAAGMHLHFSVSDAFRREYRRFHSNSAQQRDDVKKLLRRGIPDPFLGEDPKRMSERLSHSRLFAMEGLRYFFAHISGLLYNPNQSPGADTLLEMARKERRIHVVGEEAPTETYQIMIAIIQTAIAYNGMRAAECFQERVDLSDRMLEDIAHFPFDKAVNRIKKVTGWQIHRN